MNENKINAILIFIPKALELSNVNEITYRFQLVLFLFNFLKKEFHSSQADQKRKICKVFKTWKI